MVYTLLNSRGAEQVGCEAVELFLGELGDFLFRDDGCFYEEYINTRPKGRRTRNRRKS